ncbi:MAG: Gfo/Idh/MocA family protein [Tepidisphaerales bacterium]
MMNDSTISRRDFVEKAATISVIGLTAPALAAEQPAAQPVAANSRIHLGIIGCGGMGRSNLSACAKSPDVVVTAACDVQEARRNAVVAQFKDTCKGYADFREMLQQKDLDAVIIATPPHWHALIAIAACEAGKDIYLQKPMTLHLGESLAVRNAVKKHNRICQVGTQIHASENYRRVVEFIRSGNLGKIGVARTFNVMNQGEKGLGTAPASKPDGIDWEMWVGPAPMRPFNKLMVVDAYNHSSWMDYGGGWTPGMAPHIIDLPIWALDLGLPTNVSSSGGRFFIKDDGDMYDHHEVLWQYPNMTMTWMSSLTNSYGFDFHGQPVPKRRLGIYFHGTNGTMYADYGMFRIVPEGDAMKGLEAPAKSIPPSPGHEREWLNCIASRQQPSCSPAYHVKIDVPVVLSLLSLKLGRSIRFDPATETIVNDAEAAKLAVPTYRAPWKFPIEYLNA